jgi:hypothetical protein
VQVALELARLRKASCLRKCWFGDELEEQPVGRSRICSSFDLAHRLEVFIMVQRGVALASIAATA